MPFTNPKCAKCMAEYESVITKINEETKTITTERVKKGKCDESCLSIEKLINKRQHYSDLILWRERRKTSKKLTIKMVDDMIDFLDEMNHQMFPHGREAAVEELERKIEEAGCVNQENKS